MSEVSIITNDEIMEMTQLVFDRYYTELKRQLRRGEIPTEEAEQYCTEILSKVYQALQIQRVAATSYEMDACAIPIINEELRKILVPLHLNGYRNLRENPITEKESKVDAVVDNESVVKTVPSQQNDVAEVKETEVTEVKKEAVQVVSNGEVQVYPENAEDELNPELRTEIRRILQQEFQLEPAQVKPVVVVVNVTAPQAVQQPDAATQTRETPGAAMQTEAVQDVSEQKMVQQETIVQATMQGEEAEAEIVFTQEEKSQEVLAEFDNFAGTTEFEQGQERKPAVADSAVADSEVAATVNTAEGSSSSAMKEAEEEENKHLGLWIPIIMLLLVLLWLTIGMLMSYDIVPEFNLGYEWFNKTLFELF